MIMQKYEKSKSYQVRIRSQIFHFLQTTDIQAFTTRSLLAM